MEIYLLKSVACLALFYGFYKLLLEQESVHRFKRFYLLGSIVASFCIPLITFTTYIDVVTVPISFSESSIVITTASEITTTLNYWSIIIWTVYGLGAAFMLLKLLNNLFCLFQKIRKNPHVKTEKLLHVLLKNPTTPHTFFNYIFLNHRKFQQHQIPQEVLLHERAHALQKHSVDILLIELLLVVFWFNPLFYLFKKSIKLNHEFLADGAVLHDGYETTTYQEILLAFSSNAPSPAMANSINYSSFKKRFTVMKKQSSRSALWLRSSILLCLLAIVLYSFTTTQEVERIASDTKITTFQNPEMEDPYNSWYDSLITTVPIQKGATVAQLKEYNALAKKYNAVDIEKRIIKLKDLETLERIYKRMTPAQKKTAAPFPECFPPPPPPPPPAPEDVKVRKGENDSHENLPPPPPPPSSSLGNVLEKYENSIILYFNGENIYLNGKKTSITSFTDALNKQTEDWKESDFNLYGLSIQTENVSEAFRKQINTEYAKSNLAKKSSQSNPKLINVKNTTYHLAPGKIIGLNEVPHEMPLSLPPGPERPLDHIIAMAKRNGTFYYKGKKIDSDAAISLLKKNPDLNIQTRLDDPRPPTTYIQKEPIQLGKTIATNTQKATLNIGLFDPPNLAPETVPEDPRLLLKLLLKKGVGIFLEGHPISEKEAFRILKQHTVIKIDTLETPHDVPSINLSTIK